MTFEAKSTPVAQRFESILDRRRLSPNKKVELTPQEPKERAKSSLVFKKRHQQPIFNKINSTENLRKTATFYSKNNLILSLKKEMEKESLKD